ncbi:uncharacterized protein [Chelonus insularis]|uniref:uncharacterized protein n=1 Tax=Chelonus insularis TaxID=460826 RepID=UPI00158E379D|nr:uncharacterized protein LOC118071895 [Chelonus insularis]
MRCFCVFRFFVTFIIIFQFVNSENSLKEINKFTEDELQMCISSFSVHSDKIIRTQDSLMLGAKYIMEAELDNREDCLKLCCKTKECDVFIFEEKKQGSCYLFHCGPPHDFKCKFTTHANYSSAVLTNLNYRNTIHHEDQIRRSQQEHELKSLRKMRDRSSIEYVYTEASGLVITESPQSLISTTSPPKTICHRNQYECRTSHDCIAIYNVCDGIPQCADGSDEASDLGCPTEKPTPPPPVLQEQILTAPELSKYPVILPHHKNYPPFYNNPEIPAKAWQSLPQQPGLQYPSQQMMHLSPNNYGSQGYANNWDYRQMYDQNKESYPSLNNFHGKNDITHYDQESSHIFNHKKPGMLVENVEENREVGRPYIESERPYEPYYPRQNHESWHENQAVEIQQKSQPTESPTIERQEIKETSDVKKTGPIIKENKLPPEESSTLKENSNIKKELETQKNVHPPKQLDLSVSKTSHDKENITMNHPNKSIETLNKPIEKHEEVRIHHFVAEHLQQNNNKNSNAILKPKGAVISLSIGVVVTLIMIMLITCRLRIVRKRGRRHGPFAHDADYLMNGMYL